MSESVVRKIKVGIWGLGRAGSTMHVPELKRYAAFFEPVAACDLIPERGEAFLKEYPQARFYTDGEAFLADPETELVSIVVRSQEHVEFTRRALSKGKYVFLEKPFGLSEADSDELRKLSGQYPGKLFFRFNRRFEAAFNHLREIMDSGILGDVFEIKLCRHRFQFRRDWQTLLECGGGQLNNWGPHLIDHALILLGSPIRDLWADFKRTAALGSAEDHIKILFRGQNGRIIDLEISDGIALPGPVYFVAGTRGTLVAQDESEFHLRYLAPEFQLPPIGSDPGTPGIGSGYGREIQAVWLEKTIPVKPANGAFMGDIYERVYRTMREGVPFPVRLEEALAVVRTTAKLRSLTDIQYVNGNGKARP